MFKKVAAAATIAIVVILATPMAAQARYILESEITVSDSTPEPGGTVTVTFTAGAFGSEESVSFTLTGEDAASATLASLQAVTSKSITKTANLDGSVVLTINLPPTARGGYQVVATGLGTDSSAGEGNIGTASFAVTPADVDQVAVTGTEFPMLVVWIAAGALALGVALILVLTIRRQRGRA